MATSMPDAQPVRVLSFHAAYACRDSGVCCSSSWPIPVEREQADGIASALRTGMLVPINGRSREALVTPPDAPSDTPALLGTAGSHCVFFDARQSRHCRVHRALGHGALPLSCRQFPRITVRAPAAASVTLSHYCPTAAALLHGTDRVSIQTGTASFPSSGEYVGLDARDHLPPLLRPGLLMNWEAWIVWEEMAVDLLANSGRSAVSTMAILHAAVEHLRRWQPGHGSLVRRVQDAFHIAEQTPSAFAVDWPARVREVVEAIPIDFRGRYADRVNRQARVMPALTPDVLGRFLAAHAFANWSAYLGAGLRAWFRSIEAASALIEAGFDPGEADLLLRHLADTDALTRIWNRAER